jgi:hypothetical protein
MYSLTIVQFLDYGDTEYIIVLKIAIKPRNSSLILLVLSRASENFADLRMMSLMKLFSKCLI